MKVTEPDSLLQNCIKSLNEEEVHGYQELVTNLEEEVARQVMITGEKFRSSSPANGTWFVRVLPVIAKKLSLDNLEIWLVEAAKIARGNWESSLAFLKYSIENISKMGATSYLSWVKIGRVLDRFSSKDAIWFFKYGGVILEDLPEKERVKIANFVLNILECSWPAALASFKALPDVIRKSNSSVVEEALELGHKMVIEFPDAAEEYFLALPQFIRKVGSTFVANWVKPTETLAITNQNRQMVANYFKYSPEIFTTFKREEFSANISQWASWGRRLGNFDPGLASVFFEKTLPVLKKVSWSDFELYIDQIEKVYREHTLEGAVCFIKKAPEILEQLDINETEQWVDFGLFSQKSEKKLAYFLLKSQESRDALSRFRKGLLLESVKKVLTFYCEGLTGSRVKIRSAADLPSKIHKDEKLFCSIDTRRVYLPAIIKVSGESQLNLNLYKGMLMHQLARKEFGTLDLDKNVFRELADKEDLGFVFLVIESCRVDYLAIKKYPGLAKLFQQATFFEILQEFFVDKEKQGSNQVNLNQAKKIITEFWKKVKSAGSSAKETLAFSRQILELLDHKDIRRSSLNNPQYTHWGKLRYDLIYISKILDEEISLKGKQSEGKHSKTNSTAGFSPYSEFNLWLKKLLLKFLEDEENPYRLVAYYDEWDRTLNDFKKDWCTVREIVLKPSTGRFVEQTLIENYGMINTLKRYFGMLRPDRFRKYKRQEDGDEIDIDAVIEAMVERQAGTSSAGGFYIRRDKRERDVAVGFLMDLSYSTDEVIPGTNKTLLDLEQESVIVMAEALEVLGDKYGIYGFTSDSREKINFYVVKDFEEVYSKEIKQRFGGLKSYGMTRLAAAVRHATNKLEKVNAAIKILIILSDGRPFDFDYHSGITKEYEDFYAEEDTKMAFRESKMKGIKPFCITVDTQGQEYMEYIYGNVNYIIIDNVNDLPIKLTETYKNLTS